MSDCLTSVRVGILKRSTKKATEVFSVEVPEMPWAYNVYGRSGTDGHDQMRKDNQIANRRVLRDGVKGMLFTFDVCLTNACIMNKVAVDTACDLMGTEKEKRLLKETVTKKAFLERLTDQVFSGMSLRKYTPASSTQAAASQPNEPRCRAMDQEHHSAFLVDFRRQFQKERAVAIRDKKARPKAKKKGRCAVCTQTDDVHGRSIWTHLWCRQCEKWLHHDCAQRRCTPKRRLGADATIGAC
jgi:hypothetical protein